MPRKVEPYKVRVEISEVALTPLEEKQWDDFERERIERLLREKEAQNQKAVNGESLRTRRAA